MENNYGSSVIDAVRRNTLPLYLDALLSGGLGGNSNVLTAQIVLPVDGWVIEETSTVTYSQVADLTFSEDTSSLIVFGDLVNQVVYADCEVKGIYDESTQKLVFKATKQPAIQLIVVVLVIGGKSNLPNAENYKF